MAKTVQTAKLCRRAAWDGRASWVGRSLRGRRCQNLTDGHAPLVPQVPCLTYKCLTPYIQGCGKVKLCHFRNTAGPLQESLTVTDFPATVPFMAQCDMAWPRFVVYPQHQLSLATYRAARVRWPCQGGRWPIMTALPY